MIKSQTNGPQTNTQRTNQNGSYPEIGQGIDSPGTTISWQVLLFSLCCAMSLSLPLKRANLHSLLQCAGGVSARRHGGWWVQAAMVRFFGIGSSNMPRWNAWNFAKTSETWALKNAPKTRPFGAEIWHPEKWASVWWEMSGPTTSL